MKTGDLVAIVSTNVEPIGRGLVGRRFLSLLPGSRLLRWQMRCFHVGVSL